MPNWKAFAKVGVRVAGVMVPQIAQAEKAFSDIRGAGPDKKRAVLDGVLASVDLAEALSGHEVADQALLVEGLAQINDGYVKVMKALRAEREPAAT